VIAYESETEDTGVEGRPLNLGYLSQYSVINMERDISRGAVVLLVLVSLGVIALIAAGVAALVGNVVMLRVAQVSLGVLLLGSLIDIALLIILLRRRRQALRTPAREPSFHGEGAYPIHWWELRAAGFSPRRYEDVLYDEELGIDGRPWVVLVRGLQRIPVLRMNGDNDGVYENHTVRVAGYCQLIEAATNCESPYGIVLLPRRLDAMAIPFTPTLKAELRDTIDMTRDAVAKLPAPPEEPADTHICRNCPLAHPRRYVFGKSNTVYRGDKLPPVSVKAKGAYWHTTCGDRFQWKPPTLVALEPASARAS
jgi:hypothetical protein